MCVCVCACMCVCVCARARRVCVFGGVNLRTSLTHKWLNSPAECQRNSRVDNR